MQQEERLTLTGEDLYWKNEECWLDAERPDSHKIDQVYYKLAEYEDTGLSPAEIEALEQRAEVAEEALRNGAVGEDLYCSSDDERHRLYLHLIREAEERLKENKL